MLAKVGHQRPPLPKGKNKKVVGLMNNELG